MVTVMVEQHVLTASEDHTVPHGHQVGLQIGLDFINTYELERGRQVDHLTDLDTSLDWLREHQLLHQDAVLAARERAAEDPATGERVLGRIRRVRDAMRDLVEAQADRRSPSRDHLAEVNRALRTHYVYVLVPATDGVSLDHRHEGDPIEGALGRLVESVAREVSQGHVERLRVCANDACRWVYFDTSRTGRRRWCDMATCGNRAKAARHRERRRETATDTERPTALPLA